MTDAGLSVWWCCPRREGIVAEPVEEQRTVVKEGEQVVGKRTIVKAEEEYEPTPPDKPRPIVDRSTRPTLHPSSASYGFSDLELSLLSEQGRTRALHKLLTLPLEQLILLQNNTSNDETLQEHNPRITHLNTRMEKATIKTEHYPLPAKILEENTRYFYNGMYLNAGDKFNENVHGHPYYLKIIEATPNGSRFDENTELTLING
jgi:hypothetical protein